MHYLRRKQQSFMENLKSIMAQHGYSLSFTTSSLRTLESVKLARLYAKYQNWSVVRDHVIEYNTLQQRTTTSSKKLCRELLSRLKLLSDDELEYLTDCPESEAALIVWVAACRRYAFIRDFVLEVLAERRLQLSIVIEPSDFNVFFSSKLAYHNELESISVATRHKVQQVIFTMLREAGFLGRQNTLNIVTPAVETLRILDSPGREVITVLGIHEMIVGNASNRRWTDI